MRPNPLLQPNIRLTESVTDLVTILRYFLSFKTVFKSWNSTAFKITFSLQKNDHLSWCTLFSTSSRKLAWISLPSTNFHVLKVRIDLSLYYLDARLKRYEGKKYLSRKLQTHESLNGVRISGLSWMKICVQTVCNKVDTKVSNRILVQ